MSDQRKKCADHTFYDPECWMCKTDESRPTSPRRVTPTPCDESDLDYVFPSPVKPTSEPSPTKRIMDRILRELGHPIYETIRADLHDIIYEELNRKAGESPTVQTEPSGESAERDATIRESANLDEIDCLKAKMCILAAEVDSLRHREERLAKLERYSMRIDSTESLNEDYIKSYRDSSGRWVLFADVERLLRGE